MTPLLRLTILIAAVLYSLRQLGFTCLIYPSI